jgi:hypothetical protein
MSERLKTFSDYYRVHDQLLAGEYPADRDRQGLQAKLRQLLGGQSSKSRNGLSGHARLSHLLDAGVTVFLDLTEEQEKDLLPYAPTLLAIADDMGRTVQYQRMPVRDFGTPTADQMCDILNLLDAAIADGQTVYLHCGAGIGRTGTVVGCYLVRHGRDGLEALEEVLRLRRGTTTADSPSPATEEQRRLVYSWAEFDTPSCLDEPQVLPVKQDDGLHVREMPLAGWTGSNSSRTSLLRVREHARAYTIEMPAIQPDTRRKRRNLAIAILSIVAVAAVLVITLALSTGRIVVRFRDRRITLADLGGDDLQGANLAGADLSTANLAGADLRGANLRGANLSGVNLSGANLSRAILSEADLHYALLIEANLREADLRGANLRGVALTSADLTGAQLEGANVENTRLEDAILPDGSRSRVVIEARRFTDPTYPGFWRPGSATEK